MLDTLLETRRLSCELQEHEVANRAMRMARLVEEIKKRRAQLKATIDEAKEEIRVLSSDVERLAKEVRERAEERDVSVSYRHDDRRFCVDTYRLDTQEVVDTRPMTDAERGDAMQPALPGTGPKPRKGNAAEPKPRNQKKARSPVDGVAAPETEPKS